MARILIIGSGPNAAEEVERARTTASGNRRFWDITVGVNYAAERYGPVDVQCTIHPKLFAGNRKLAPYLVSTVGVRGCDEILHWNWPGCDNSGSGGLYAVKWALNQDPDQVVLAGVGIDLAPHDTGGRVWEDAARFRPTWEYVKPQLEGVVTSMGGWTRELLGAPSWDR
jgi:hypothetical protein